MKNKVFFHKKYIWKLREDNMKSDFSPNVNKYRERERAVKMMFLLNNIWMFWNQKGDVFKMQKECPKLIRTLLMSSA